MKKTSVLSKEQEELIPVYRDKWLKIGLSTDRFSVERGKEISDYYYKNILGKPTVPVIVVDSPLAAWYAVSILSTCSHDQVENQVRGQVWNQVRNQVSDQVWNQVRNQVENQVENQVSNKVWNQVRDQVENQVWNQVSNKVSNYVHPYIDGHLYAHYFSFYNYFSEVLSIKFPCQEKYDWYQSTCEIGHFYPLEHVCVISQKPIEYNFNSKKQLHSESGAAIKYADGFSVYSLNGIGVPEYLAVTPSGNLNLDFFMNEKNADIRTEFIRKYGIDRMISLGKELDSYKNYTREDWFNSEYKLIDMSAIFDTVDYAPHLYMKNQTTDVYHLEGVSPDCNTLIDAFRFRESRGVDEDKYETIFVK